MQISQKEEELENYELPPKTQDLWIAAVRSKGCKLWSTTIGYARREDLIAYLTGNSWYAEARIFKIPGLPLPDEP